MNIIWAGFAGALNALLASFRPFARNSTGQSSCGVEPWPSNLMKKHIITCAAWVTYILLTCHAFAQTNPASVVTDKSDYAPGETVQITGSGFQPGETVQLQVLRIDVDENSGPEHDPWQVSADANGSFQATWVVTSDEVGATLQLTAAGQSSGLSATAQFTDASKNWTGATSSDWNTASNWSPSGVPATGDSVTLTNGSANYPILNVPANNSIKGLTMNSGATLTVNSGGGLTNTGTSTVGGTLIVSGNVDPGNITINSGGVMTVNSTGSINGSPVILDNGILTNNGTMNLGAQNFTAGTGIIYMIGGTLICHDINPTTLTFNISGGTVTCHNFSPNLTMSGGLLQISGTLNANSFAATGGTVEYNNAGNQAVAAEPYFNLTLSGSGTKTLVSGTSVANTLSIDPTGTAVASIGNGLTLNVHNLVLGGVTQVAGSWGGTGSGASHVNTTYFAGTTGQLNSTGGIATKLVVTLPGQTFTSGTGNSGAASSQTAGVAFNISLSATDASSNVDTSYSGSQTVSYSGPGNAPNGATPAYTTTVTFTNGQAANIATTLFKAETTTITATNAGLAGVASSSLTVNAAAASQLAFTTSPITVVVGQTSGAITIQRQDAFKNPAISGTTTVNLSTTSAGGTFLSTNGVNAISSTNIVGGASTASYLYKDSLAGSPIITNSASGIASVTQTETVNKGGTSVALTSPVADPSVYGQSGITFHVVVSVVAPGSGTPSGTVQFKTNGVNFGGVVALSSGAADSSALPTTLLAGSYSVTAVYGGDANFNTNTSSTLTQTINQSGSSVALTSPVANPSIYGQSGVTFHAVASAVAPGSGMPTGTVQFKTNGVNFGGAVTLSSGAADSSALPTTLSVGSYSITASYNGDANFGTSTSGTLNQTINKAASSAAIVSSLNPAPSGSNVVFTATISSTGGTPTGVVIFSDGATPFFTNNLSGGSTTATNSALSHTNHTITASYAGDANFTGSTNSLSELINSAPIAGTASYGRPKNIPLKFKVSDLLTNASDPDGDPISLAGLSSHSTNNAAVSIIGSFVVYQPPSTNANVTDRFNYTVSDPFGATNNGTVIITILPDATGQSLNITGILVTNGTALISFAGVPSRTYLVQATTNLPPTATWVTIGTNTAATNGLFQFLDTQASNFPVRFYRSATP